MSKIHIYMSEATKQRLRAIPLEDVMRANGHTPVRRTARSTFYHCPVPGHADEDASFSIEREGQRGTQRFHCLGCNGAAGQGAIDLQATLMGLNAEGDGFLKACERLSRDFCIPIDGHDQNVWYRRCEKVQPQDGFTYEECPWTDDMLRSLGCQVAMTYSGSGMADGAEEATGVESYSWGEGFYDGRRTCDSPNFNPSEINRVFGCYPVSSFTLPAKTDRDGNRFSTRITSSPSYPVFVIESMDDRDRGRVKKYEPYCQPDKFGVSYKNTWYYRDGYAKSKGVRFAGALYGDCDVMDCLLNDDAVPQDTSTGNRHPVDEVSSLGSDGRYHVTSKFRRIVICSGLRDALSVYYHSDAHVVYPHSESSGIDSSLLKRLLSLSDQVYILFDSDKTGQQNARAINMQYPRLRNVELPADLDMLTERRTGKPCKDVAAYFEHYGQTLTRDRMAKQDINRHFQSLLSRSVPLKFWQRRCISTQREQEAGVLRYRYQIVTDSMTRFLTYSGLRLYDEAGSSEGQFVFIRDNVVETISEKNVLVRARQIMKDYLRAHPQWNDPDLSTVISTSKGINLQTIREIGHAVLNFHSYGEDFDYLFFRNGALRVTASEATLEDYRDFPYNVNRESILPVDWRPTERLFDIVPNEDMRQYEERHRHNLALLAKGDGRAVRMENMRFTNETRLWQYRLVLRRPMEEMPAPFRFLYDTCRVFWREEEELFARGEELGKEEQQFQDAHFINKAGGLGYMLSRFRTGARQQMGQLVDYRVSDEKKNSGRNGKSLLASFLSCARVGCRIGGKSFKTSPDSIAKNFRDYRPSVHGFIYIDDLMRNFNAEVLFNISTSITVKNLYHDEVSVSEDESAKILFSSNRCFDMTDPSTFGRLYPMMVSDYYHAASVDGTEERSPYQKFGHTLASIDDSDEYHFTVGMLVQFLQFYLSHHRVIIPPLEQGGMFRYIHRAIRDKRFVGWAAGLFSGRVFGLPIPKQDLLVSLFQYKGMVVSKQAIDAYSKSPEFFEMLRTYCSLMGIRVNPDAVFVRKSDASRTLPRAKTFVYDFTPDGRLAGTRSCRNNVNVYYFYRDSDLPQDASQIITSRDADPFPDGYLPEE